ncbi:MAG: amidohydrolase family protein [Promethearchaeota archaeon]
MNTLVHYFLSLGANNMGYAIENGTIITCNKKFQVLKKGTILIKNGKIHDIYTEEKVIPEKYKRYDATGKVILPGFIDSHTHQGLWDGSIGQMGSDGNECTSPATPMVRAIDAINVETPAFKEAVKGGVTTIHTGPGSGNVIGGECIILKTYAKSSVIDDYIVKVPSALKAALGENPKRVYGSDKKLPSTRMGIAAVFRKAFIDAKTYQEKWLDYEKKIGDDNVKDKPSIPERDIAKENLVKVLNKEIPINIHCHQANDIVTAIRLIEEFDLNAMLVHATEGEKIAEFIASKKIPVSIGPSLAGFEKPELRNISFTTPGVLHKAGVKISIQSDSFTRLRYFQILPCMAVKEGLPLKEAIKAITINAAEMIGVADKIGSIEKGKDADIVVWSDNPIENFYAENLWTLVNGETAYKKEE